MSVYGQDVNIWSTCQYMVKMSMYGQHVALCIAPVFQFKSDTLLIVLFTFTSLIDISISRLFFYLLSLIW